MELRELENFLKIAEYENITRAARELNIAQPHLTRQLQALEQELGVQLFVRERKRLHITEEGRFLRQQAGQMLRLADKTRVQIAEMESGLSGTLYIGSIETVGTVYLPQWIAGFKEQYPQIHYNLWSANSTDVIERLGKGLLDIGLVRAPFDTDAYDSLHVLDEEWVVLLHKDRALAQTGSEELTLEELAGEELLVPTQRIPEIAGWFEARGLTSNIICGFAPLMNAIVMAESDLGVAILPESCLRMVYSDNIVVRHLAERPTSSVSFVWRRQYELPGAARRFLEFVGAHPVASRIDR